ncbi:MAG: hypothetical protein OEP48_07535 [Betaproteobacteria bacterium]|nr:hypothetical protein [Betaproteobacteria bacterium]MDH3435376.1 hypothetical protein [Betaproteobacteria bacterium]
MRKAAAIWLTLVISAWVHAEPMVVTIPGDGWHLFIDVPPILNLDGKSRDGRFRFIASETVTGITLSVHTENSGAESDERCRDAHWSKTARNPIIDQTTVRMYSSDVFSAVTYNIEGEYRGQHAKASNGHFYFTKMDKCVDVHVSKYPYVDGDEKIIKRIGDTIRALDGLQ